MLFKFEQWLRRERRLSETTIRLYMIMIRWALRTLNKANLSIEDVEILRDIMEDRGFSKTHQFNTLTAIQHWLNFRGTRIKIQKPKRQKKSPTYLTESEAKNLLNSCDNVHDKAIISTLLYSGLRVSELCALDKEDIDFEESLIHVRHGKGDNDDYVVVDRNAINAIKDYLLFREDNSNVLFLSKFSKRYTRKGIGYIVKKYANKASITKHITPHTLRHTLATNLLKNGCSLPFIQQQLRHKQVETTMIYLHTNKDMLKEAYKKHCPRF